MRQPRILHTPPISTNIHHLVRRFPGLKPPFTSGFFQPCFILQGDTPKKTSIFFTQTTEILAVPPGFLKMPRPKYSLTPRGPQPNSQLMFHQINGAKLWENTTNQTSIWHPKSGCSGFPFKITSLNSSGEAFQRAATEWNPRTWVTGQDVSPQWPRNFIEVGTPMVTSSHRVEENPLKIPWNMWVDLKTW